MSGGTEEVVAFAMRVAISQMLAARSGMPLGLLILDEPFTSFDADRRRSALEFLDKLSDVFPQIMLISHQQDMYDSATCIIKLEYDPVRCRTKMIPMTDAQRDMIEDVDDDESYYVVDDEDG